jgi:uncharacterized membrane protein YgdD (TMEM256/DUF423 family)
LAVAALLAAAAIALGAFGAHALAGRFDPRQRELWETAARYLFYSAVGGVALEAASESLLGGRGGSAVALLLAGGAIFAATLGAMALGAPRILGAITPLGGIAMMAGFTLFALAALRRPGG